MKSPIFIFSLPRAGSTLLQRVLMSHSEIASLAEPWLLLPFFYTLKQYGTLAEYGHSSGYRALNTFINNLPRKQEDYDDKLKKFFVALYEKQCTKNETYFLDKTPRYYLIIPEITRLFPDAKFIFLFRSPIQVMSSMIETWCNGTFKGMHRYDMDFKKGPGLLSQGYKLLEDKAYALQYEQFITHPEKYTAGICKYLDIPFDPEMLNNFSKQDTKGTMGDPTGTKKYKTIQTQSLDKWKNTFDNKYRQNFIYNYVSSIESNVLETQGYKKHEILEEIESLNVKNNFGMKDRFDMLYRYLVRFLKPIIWFGKTTKKCLRTRYLS